MSSLLTHCAIPGEDLHWGQMQSRLSSEMFQEHLWLQSLFVPVRRTTLFFQQVTADMFNNWNCVKCYSDRYASSFVSTKNLTLPCFCSKHFPHRLQGLRWCLKQAMAPLSKSLRSAFSFPRRLLFLSKTSQLNFSTRMEIKKSKLARLGFQFVFFWTTHVR